MGAPVPFPWSDYVGIPWLDRGRDLRGCDCWGLYRLLLLAGRGIDLPSYGDDYAGPADRAAILGLIDGDRDLWRLLRPDEVAPLDLVLVRGSPWHVGAVVRPGLMLHVPEGRTSVIEPTSTGRYSRRVEGIYRYEAHR